MTGIGADRARGLSLRAASPTIGVLLALALSACAGLPSPDPLAPPPPAPIPEIAHPEPLPEERETFPDLPPAFNPADPILASAVREDPAVVERVAFWAARWGGTENETFTRYLDRMGRLATVVDAEISRRGLPTSLRYLPIVESGYLPTAVSSAGAVGLWQIMAPTGRGLGLSVTGIVDDRRDPVAATLAALDYLEELYAEFGSWILSLAAYNAGPGRLRDLVSRYGGSAPTSDETFLAIRSRLPSETRDFIPRFFAAAALGSDPEAYGLAAVRLRPWLYDEVTVPDATSLEVVARASGVPEAEILELNPHYLRGFTPPGELRAVRVPLGRSFQFDRNFALIPPNERLTFLEHVVASGETFSHIAQRYGVALSELTGMNGGIDPRRLRIGTRLLVPVGGRGAGSGSTTALASASGGVHRVASGESFWTISRIYGVSTEALAAANGKAAGDLIRIGEELRIP